MKSALMSFIVIALAAGVGVLAFFLFNTIYGKEFEKRIGEMEMIDVSRNAIEAIKSFSKLSLAYSSQRAFRESACFGGLISDKTWYWICNGYPNVPDINEVRSCAEKFTKEYLNSYFVQYELELPLNIFRENFTECTAEITPAEVFSGTYDEGYFWINCSGAKISLASEKFKSSEEINVSYFLVKNRFWYLFRKIAEWAKENVYGGCVCSMTKTCASCPDAIKACAQAAFQSLQEKFEEDESVECEIVEKVSCCHSEFGPECGENEQCAAWSKECEADCHPECAQIPPPRGVCTPQNLLIFKPKEKSTGEKMKYLYFQSAGNCKIWREYRLEGKSSFKCVDHKYYVPSPKGPVPLVFNINVHAGFRVEHPTNGPCEQYVDCTQPNCECPQGFRECTYHLCENGKCVKKTEYVCGTGCPSDECSSDDECSNE